MTQSSPESYGLRRSVLLIACLFLIGANACGKSETESASKAVSNTLNQAKDSTGKLTEKTKEMAKDAITSAEKIVDNAKEGAKDAYDAAGNMVRKTADKADDSYKAAEKAVQNVVGQTDNTTASDSGGGLESKMPDKTGEVVTSVKKSVTKAVEDLPSLPGK